MNRFVVSLVGVSLLAAVAGCAKDYGKTRPPVDELSDDGRGLQGKDVQTASDRMAQSLLTLPAMNGSPKQWTIVVDHVENLSSTQRQNLDLFLYRTRVRLSQLSQGRVLLVENRDKLRQLQSRELDVPPDAAVPGATLRVQPDFALNATLSDLPNRETNYFLVEFKLTNLRDGTMPWTDMYEVAVKR